MTNLWAGAGSQPQLPFRRLFRRLNRPVPSDSEIVTAYTDGQVTLRSNRNKERYHEAKDLSTYQGVEPGDFVVHGLDIMRGSVGVSNSRGAISPVCIIARPRENSEPRYMAYVMRLQADSGFPKAMARGVRDGGADFRRWETLAELPLPCPPVAAQRAIADYLDQETARIDALVGKQTTLIERLHERRSALTVEILSGRDRGANLGMDLVKRDPNVEFRPFSGGEVIRNSFSNQWNFARFGEMFHESPLRNGRDPVGIPLSVSEYRGVVPRDTKVGQMESEDIASYRIVKRGELAVNMMWLNRVGLGVSEFTGYVSPAYKVFRISRLLDCRYVNYVLRSEIFRSEFERLGRGVRPNAQMVDAAELHTLPFPVPPMVDQMDMVFRLDEETAKIDALITKTQRMIDLSRERRSALITAAVTGQIDVTEGIR